jgi:hypothetical protein
MKTENKNNLNENRLSYKTRSEDERQKKTSSDITNEYSPILSKGNQIITYKSLNVNLAQNKIEIRADVEQNTDPFDISKNMAQNNDSDLLRDSVASSLFAKSFLEKFFNGETDLSVDENVLFNDNLNNETKNQQNNNVEEFIEKLFNIVPEKNKSNLKVDSNQNGLGKVQPRIVSEIESPADIFEKNTTHLTNKCIESLVVVRNQLYSNAELISIYLKIHHLLSNSQIANVLGNRKALSNCHCILNCLDCCFYKLTHSNIPDEKCVETCCGECQNEINRETIYQNKLDYLKNQHSNSEAIQSLFKNLLSASNLLYEPKINEFFAKFFSNKRCKCLTSNNFSCCLKALLDNVENMRNDHFPQSFQDYSCCGICEQFDMNPIDIINKESIENTEIALNNKQNELKELSNDVKLIKMAIDQFENVLDIEKQSISQKSKENQNQSAAKPKAFKPTLSLTPRKTIIKQKQPSESAKEPFSSTRSSKGKTVQFIEDPKYGFLPVKLSD